MARLQLGDTININYVGHNSFTLGGIEDVVPVKYDSISETWVVCAQNSATNMLVVMNTSAGIHYMFIEIGKCKNIYLLADAIVN